MVSSHNFNSQHFNFRISNPRARAYAHFKMPFVSSNLPGTGPDSPDWTFENWPYSIAWHVACWRSGSRTPPARRLAPRRWSSIPSKAAKQPSSCAIHIPISWPQTVLQTRYRTHLFFSQSYISKGIWRQGISSFLRNSCVSTLCPVVICPYSCTSDSDLLCKLSWAWAWALRSQRSIAVPCLCIWSCDQSLVSQSITISPCIASCSINFCAYRMYPFPKPRHWKPQTGNSKMLLNETVPGLLTYM